MNWRWLRSPWSLVPIALVSAVAGVIGWGGLNMAMEATNSLEFCTSCHVMRDNVYQEYKKTVHYQNRSGVRAICSDCHVPRDWSHKVVRKITAVNELYHWALGSIDTRDKFEAKRHELARHEWERMRANGSRECRNCHAFEAMDFHKQNAKSAKAMQEAMKAGKSCIDCHKGIAHTLPDVAAGHRKIFAALQAEAAKLVPVAAATLYAIGAVPFHLDGEGEPAGEIAPTTAVEVREVTPDSLSLDLTGWQREGSPDVLYQRQGARIVAATLSETAIAHLETLATKTDDDTGFQWTQARLRVVTPPGRFVSKLDKLWSLGARMHDDNCALCHVLKPPGFATANDWIGHVNAMKRYTPLNDEEVALLRSYLQHHAKK